MNRKTIQQVILWIISVGAVAAFVVWVWPDPAPECMIVPVVVVQAQPEVPLPQNAKIEYLDIQKRAELIWRSTGVLNGISPKAEITYQPKTGDPSVLLLIIHSPTGQPKIVEIAGFANEDETGPQTKPSTLRPSQVVAHTSPTKLTD